ncbi:hypothetical protein OEZ86_010283 [Tetradesmus obliquus]|nr:hypothetical protein OEZ86_010283 [Tetradesmus obliquus]
MAELHERYFDPISLLSEDAMVPCEFQHAVRHLGRVLEPTSTSEDLRKDTRAELPLWLAKSLTERGITRMDAPAVYGEWMQRQVDAGANTVSLKQTPYFYTVGMQCAATMGDSSVAGFLRKAFAERSAKLLTGSLKAPDGAALAAVTSKLNEEEKTLYEAGRQGAAAQEQWWAAGGHTALLLNSNAANKAGVCGVKRRRTTTEAAGDKENLV